MPRVHIVTTGGPDDGQGHVSRAVAMAEGLIAAGAVVTVEMLGGNLTEAQGSRLESLGVGSEAPSDPEVVLVDLPDPNVIRDRWPAERLAVFDDREWYEGSAALLIQPS